MRLDFDFTVIDATTARLREITREEDAYNQLVVAILKGVRETAKQTGRDYNTKIWVSGAAMTTILAYHGKYNPIASWEPHSVDHLRFHPTRSAIRSLVIRRHSPQTLPEDITEFLRDYAPEDRD